MSDLPSRRDVLAACLILPLTVNADTPANELNTAISPEEELLMRAKKANADNARRRQNHALRENSEPCFTYIAEPRQVRER